MTAINGHAAVIKLLIPNIDYDEEYFRGRKCQWSPIYYAAMNAHINVIKILAPLTKYLNHSESKNGIGIGTTLEEVAARFNDYETSRKNYESKPSSKSLSSCSEKSSTRILRTSQTLEQKFFANIARNYYLVPDVTVLLSLTVFLNTVSQTMPNTSDAVPLISTTSHLST